ncbi:MAG: proline dehydrogenase family protein [Acidobacteriaceae bacterium]|nr:proline dehydrogenase family protein [Acidobacteriaceae bacterium]
MLEVVLRSGLLYLSHQRWLRNWMETSPFANRLVSRFVAGSTLASEVEVIRKLNAEGIQATLDWLGENVTTLAEAEASRDAYLAGLEQIQKQGLRATVSIKLTQFGLDLSNDACVANVECLCVRAKAIGSRVEVDMESSAYVDRTLAIVRRLHERYGCVRAVIQAYLRRSESDIEDLNVRKIPVRLCKGAYNEPPDVAFAKKSEVDANYVRLMSQLLTSGTYPAIASHDENIIERALSEVRQRRVGAECFEFQMLYGIRRDLQRRLVKDGYQMRLYVPYGTAWYPYFMRRLAERPANVMFLATNLLRK